MGCFFQLASTQENLFSISRTIGSIFLCVSGENFDTSSSKASFKATSISAQTSVLLHFAVSEYHLYASCNCCGSSTSTTCFTSQVVSGVLATNSTAPLKPCSCCDLICGTVVLPQVFCFEIDLKISFALFKFWICGALFGNQAFFNVSTGFKIAFQVSIIFCHSHFAVSIG